VNVQKVSTDYRSRIYHRYVENRQYPLAPSTIQELKARGPMLRKIISKHFPNDKSASILDIGCGHGAFIYFIREAGYTDVIGVDHSPEQVKSADRLGIKSISQSDLMETLNSLPGECKNVIISFDVIEHFTKTELLPFVDEVFRVLKKGGIWIIHTPNAESPFFSKVFFGDVTHETAFTRTSISQLLKSSGFNHVSCYEDTPVPHGLKSVIRFFLWKCIRGFLRFYLTVENHCGEKECIFTQNFLTVAVK
jgi:2-polyprenyl-3-methyl-5-hydroxy-6-metoxy-1,4-benzoquinol methylase